MENTKWYQWFWLCLPLWAMPFANNAQSVSWQQEANYEIAVDFDAENHSFRGRQLIRYINHSPDTLNEIYFHLFYNAFQPGSSMDEWVNNIPDPQYEMDLKIKYLTSFETGWILVNQILENNRQYELNVSETVLKAIPAEPILPGDTTLLEMSFAARIPLICRRTGRDNDEGVDYSMAQWYPKICAYDEQGWHPTPYIGREFYSDFGDYDVKIRIDSSYVLAAGADEIRKERIQGTPKNQWHFVSRKVLDFAWAADRDYTSFERRTADGTILRFYYQKDSLLQKSWTKLGEVMKEIVPLINRRFGKYPFDTYTFIQAGDGATEYPKATFITGQRQIGSLVGVSIHELMHSWYQHQLATQENRYAWMDEGFASYATTIIKQEMASKGIFFPEMTGNPLAEPYNQYRFWARSGYEEPMNTPANFFLTNTGHDMASYTKAEIFLHQLAYIIGDDTLEKTLRTYYAMYAFKHPKPEDFIRIAEKQSGMELDWYQHFWINTTHVIDYAVQLDTSNTEQSLIRIVRKGVIPMPVELEVMYTDGSSALFLIPTNLQNGCRTLSVEGNEIQLEDWPWTHPFYDIQLSIPPDQIKEIKIDPTERLADLVPGDNRWPIAGN